MQPPYYPPPYPPPPNGFLNDPTAKSFLSGFGATLGVILAVLTLVLIMCVGCGGLALVISQLGQH